MEKRREGLRVLHVIPTFYPATYWGGPIFSVYGLCNALARMPGIQLQVLTTDSAGLRHNQRVDVGSFPWISPVGYLVHYCRRLWGVSTSPGLLRRLVPMIRAADVVHLTSVYSFPTFPTLLLCRLFGKPVVWSPRGQLQRWEKSRKVLLKRIWEMICNELLNPVRSVLHVTSRDEAEEGGRRITHARVEIVENGVNIPSDISDLVRIPAGALRLLFIGRLDPKKGIENLLQALAMLDKRISLVICGAGEPGYEVSLKALVDEHDLTSRVRFMGHVEGEAKSRAFWNADVCVVPSFTENFAMVVAEALAHGVPVIAGRGTPWSEVEARGCGLWVDNDPENLAAAIGKIATMDLAAMGKRGSEWMMAEYSWEGVAVKMLGLYKGLLAEAQSQAR